MSGIRYADAGMDMKKWILVLLRKCWIVLAAASVGAALGGAVYTIARTVPESEREYRAVSKIYLDFAADETGQVYQAYNGYTWNDLMVTDPILDLTMSYLPEDYTREEVMAATEAAILSDLRLLTVTITTNHAERTDAILAATDQALEAYGSAAKEFLQIQTIQTTQASLVVADSRLAQAILVGLVIGAAAALLGLLLYYVLDDRILVASDVKQVTDVSFIGYTFTDTAENARLQSDYNGAMAYLRQSYGEVLETGVSQTENISADHFAKAREADGIVLALPYGKLHGACLSYVIGQYQAQGCKVLGVAIENADIRFLRRYYGSVIGRQDN